MPAPTDKITRIEARNALLRSGYLLESRVADQFRSRRYYVQTNDIYPDPETGKAREYDLNAMTGRKVGPNNSDFLFPVFVIECVNNPQPIGFIPTESQVPFFHHQEVKLSGLPVKIRVGGSWVQLSEFLGMEKYHHYCSGQVATQYCSFQKKKGSNEWMAFHDDMHFSAIKTLCDVVENEIDKHIESWHFETGQTEYLNIQMYYPVLVTQGELLEVEVKPRSIKMAKSKHIQFRRSILRAGKQIAYQIDIVTERFLPQFIELSESETAKTVRLLRRRHEKIREAIDLIVDAASKAKTPEEIRKEMKL